jgi:hypothetical protein
VVRWQAPACATKIRVMQMQPIRPSTGVSIGGGASRVHARWPNVEERCVYLLETSSLA